jgi:NtrC-family two-component system response regulator AlgB
LRNCIERAVILSKGLEIAPADLPIHVQGGHQVGHVPGVPLVGSMMTLEALEREHIRRVVEATPTIQEAARVLGIDAATIYRKRRKTEG